MQAMLEPQFSVLRDLALRPLPVALAHRLINAKPGDPYRQTYYRLYELLTTSDRTRCLAVMAHQSRLAGHSPPAMATSDRHRGLSAYRNLGQGNRPS